MQWLSRVTGAFPARTTRFGDEDEPHNDSSEFPPTETIDSTFDPEITLQVAAREQGTTVGPSDEESALHAIYEAFDASQPVREAVGLFGRDEQMQRLVNGVLYRRNHGVISGPRGSGKTSMVKVFGERAKTDGVVVLYAANDASAPFGLVMRQLLERIPLSSLAAGEWDAFQERVKGLDTTSGAQQVVNVLGRLAYSAVVIIVDEFDRIPDETFKQQVSSLLKLSSDARLRVRFLLVGDERTLPDVIRGHPSLSRHTTHVATGPLSDDATMDLLDSCAAAAGMTISERARSLIVDSVCGSPYHVRLFGLHAALNAHGNGSSNIDYEHAVDGLQSAFDEWASLNIEDSPIFLNLVQGGSSDRSLVATAKDLAWRTPRRAGFNNHASRDEALIQLRPTIDEQTGFLSFRDATAAQFLIALHMTRSKANSRKLKTKERSRT